MNRPDVQSLPTTIGIYIFKKNNRVLYVGKSVNIKARVLSHIENAKQSIKESNIIENATDVEYIVTDSEFKALLLESKLIQKYLPLYNVIWMDDKSYLYIKITVQDPYPKLFLVRKENDNRSIYFGPFSSVRTATALLKELRKVVPFCTQKKIGKYPCFHSKLNQCNPCPNVIEKQSATDKTKLKKIYRKNIRHIVKILKGNVQPILSILQKTLIRYSELQNYEEALHYRNRIIRLENLIYNRSFNDINTNDFYNQSESALLSLHDELIAYFPELKPLHRIECYDISNTMQKNATASMVVLIDGLLDKSEYKRFKIKDAGLRSDFGMLEEVIRRRFKNKWEYPNLIAIDGGKPQVRKIQAVMNGLNLTIPIIGIAKNPDRIVIGNPGLQTIRFIKYSTGFNLIRHLRDESHRFAHKYHLLLRDKNFIA